MSAVSAEFSHAPANVAASSGQDPGRSPARIPARTPADPRITASAAGEQDATAGSAPGGCRRAPGTDFGPNELLVDELYQRYQADPGSVDRAWWNFFADYRPEPADARRAAGAASPAGRDSLGARRAAGSARRPAATATRPAAPARPDTAQAPPAPPRHGHAGRRPLGAARGTARPAGTAPLADRAVPHRATRRPARPASPPGQLRRPPGRPHRDPAARRGLPHRGQHGGQPRGPDRHIGPGRPGQAAGRQPDRDQQSPRPRPRRQGLLHPPDRLRGRQGARRSLPS